MSDYDTLIAYQKKYRQWRMALLIEFDFKSGVQRWWKGQHRLVTTDGRTWMPSHGVGDVGPITISFDADAPEVAIEIAGFRPEFKALVGSVTRSKAEYLNRMASIYWQFFTVDWTCLDAPLAMYSGLMRNPSAKRKTQDAGVIEVISLPIESLFANRAMSPNGTLTPEDQRARHPGDALLDRAPGDSIKSGYFPVF